MENVASRASWWELAACQRTDPELFFPVSDMGAARRQVVTAKAVCAECAVRQQCLDFALSTRQAYGVWGGMSEDERRPIAGALARNRVPHAS
jgi:WhiB family transcriptional regulator, redox-sensing transcriptional regulator